MCIAEKFEAERLPTCPYRYRGYAIVGPGTSFASHANLLWEIRNHVSEQHPEWQQVEVSKEGAWPGGFLNAAVIWSKPGRRCDTVLQEVDRLIRTLHWNPSNTWLQEMAIYPSQALLLTSGNLDYPKAFLFLRN